MTFFFFPSPMLVSGVLGLLHAGLLEQVQGIYNPPQPLSFPLFSSCGFNPYRFHHLVQCNSLIAPTSTLSTWPPTMCKSQFSYQVHLGCKNVGITLTGRFLKLARKAPPLHPISVETIYVCRFRNPVDGTCPKVGSFDGDGDDEAEEIVYTTHGGECPACVASEKAILEACFQKRFKNPEGNANTQEEVAAAAANENNDEPAEQAGSSKVRGGKRKESKKGKKRSKKHQTCLIM